MNLNAAHKSISYDGRITVPRKIASVFNTEKPIYVVKYATKDNEVQLTQKMNKTNMDKIVHTFMPYNNGCVQFNIKKIFNKKNAVIYNSNANTVTVHCF